MKNLLLPTLAGMALLLAGCGDCNGPTVRATGPDEPETRTVADFTRLDASLEADVVLTQGSPASVRLEAPRNVLNVVRTDVSGGELHLTTSGVNLRLRHPVKVYITVPTLTQVLASGSGSVRTATPWMVGDFIFHQSGSGLADLDLTTTGVLRTELSGSGSVSLRGAAARHNVNLSGSGSVAAFDLAQEQASVYLSGSGNVDVRVVTSLEATVSGSGVVRYKGAPTVQSHVSGSGRVVKVD